MLGHVKTASMVSTPVKKIRIDLGRQPEKEPLVKLYKSIEGVKIRRRENNIVEITIPQSTFVGTRRAKVASKQSSAPLYKKKMFSALK